MLQTQAIAVMAPSMNGVNKKKMTAKKVSFIKKWWKSILYTLAIISTILTIAIPGYLVANQLNTFATKSDVSDVVHETELQKALKPIYDQLQKNNEEHKQMNESIQQMNNNVLKVYETIIQTKTSNKK